MHVGIYKNNKYIVYILISIYTRIYIYIRMHTQCTHKLIPRLTLGLPQELDLTGNQLKAVRAIGSGSGCGKTTIVRTFKPHLDPFSMFFQEFL